MTEQDLNIGAQLRHIRLKMGYSIQDVSFATNLRPAQIRAIETGAYDQLPGLIYAVGFVKAYADMLGLEPDAVANQFKLEYRGFEDDVETEKKQKAKQQSEKLLDTDPYEDNRVPSILTVFISLLFFIMCIAVWQAFTPEETETVKLAENILPAPVNLEVAADDIEILPSPSQAKDIPDQQGGSELTLDPSEAATPLKKIQTQEKPLPLTEKTELQKRVNTSRVVIRARKSSWIQVNDAKGNAVFKKVLRPRSEYFVPNRPGMSLSTSNAGVLDIYVDGKKVLPIGHEGDILRGVSLDPNELKKDRNLRPRRR